MHITHATIAASLAALLGACASEGTRAPDCEGEKCDTPGDTAGEECQKECKGSSDADCVTTCRTKKATEHCEARRADAVLSSQKAFTKDAIRWACSDVEGVNTNGRDDRGQEYCEYYAVVQPPPATEGGDAPPPRDLGRTGSGEPLQLELTDDQLIALEDNPDAVAGQCVFTSWHQDVAGELPVCGTAAAAGDSCPEMTLAEGAKLPPWMKDGGLGFRMTSEMLRMVVGINSNNAAVDLLERCMAEFEPVPGGCLEELPSPAPEDDYMRGCMKAYGLFCTEWRRSDPTICTSALRAAECGCGVDTNADGKPDVTDIPGIARALVPSQPQDGEITLRGFRLGTWSDADGLPAGCHYMETGDQSHTAVACNLTASDILTAKTDVKGKCRDKYGDNVVVHIPVPSDAIVCAPPADGAHTDTCGETVPWTAADPTTVEQECCKTCVTSKPCGDACIPMDATCSAEPGCACDGSSGG
jgi:hypothetical protein